MQSNTMHVFAPVVLSAMVAQKGFEEKMIINYIVLCADGLHF